MTWMWARRSSMWETSRRSLDLPNRHLQPTRPLEGQAVSEAWDMTCRVPSRQGRYARRTRAASNSIPITTETRQSGPLAFGPRPKSRQYDSDQPRKVPDNTYTAIGGPPNAPFRGPFRAMVGWVCADGPTRVLRVLRLLACRGLHRGAASCGWVAHHRQMSVRFRSAFQRPEQLCGT